MDSSAAHDETDSRQTAETRTIEPTPALTFTVAEWCALFALRTRYRQDHDLFSRRELEHLRFIRWLYRTGRLDA
jgi:hypothetical protein